MKSFILSITMVLSTLHTNISTAEVGIASFYSSRHHGKKMANGEKFNMYNKHIAAHKFLKLGTKVKVTNLKNKKSIIVAITDRGPYIKGRIIDLSLAAAQYLNITGIERVEILAINR